MLDLNGACEGGLELRAQLRIHGGGDELLVSFKGFPNYAAWSAIAISQDDLLVADRWRGIPSSGPQPGGRCGHYILNRLVSSSFAMCWHVQRVPDESRCLRDDIGNWRLDRGRVRDEGVRGGESGDLDDRHAC